MNPSAGFIVRCSFHSLLRAVLLILSHAVAVAQAQSVPDTLWVGQGNFSDAIVRNLTKSGELVRSFPGGGAGLAIDPEHALLYVAPAFASSSAIQVRDLAAMWRARKLPR